MTCWLYKGDFVTATGEPILPGGDGQRATEAAEAERAARRAPARAGVAAPETAAVAPQAEPETEAEAAEEVPSAPADVVVEADPEALLQTEPEPEAEAEAEPDLEPRIALPVDVDIDAGPVTQKLPTQRRKPAPTRRPSAPKASAPKPAEDEE